MYNGNGIQFHRAEALFNIVTEPETCTEEHILACMTDYFDRYHREEMHKHLFDKKRSPDWDSDQDSDSESSLPDIFRNGGSQDGFANGDGTIPVPACV